MDFYQKKVLEIKNLMQAKRYQEAHQILQQEKSMPYIPREFEHQFQNLEHEIKQHLHKNNSKESVITIDQIVAMLQGTKQEQHQALASLPKHNLRPIQETLKARIESWDDKIQRALLYEALAEQNIDIDIDIDNHIWNPAQFSIFKNKQVVTTFQEVELLTFKNPYLTAPALTQLRKYLLISFPFFLTDGKKLAQQIVNIVDSMFNPDRHLNNSENKIKSILKIE